MVIMVNIQTEIGKYVTEYIRNKHDTNEVITSFYAINLNKDSISDIEVKVENIVFQAFPNRLSTQEDIVDNCNSSDSLDYTKQFIHTLTKTDTLEFSRSFVNVFDFQFEEFITPSILLPIIKDFEIKFGLNYDISINSSENIDRTTSSTVLDNNVVDITLNPRTRKKITSIAYSNKAKIAIEMHANFEGWIVITYKIGNSPAIFTDIVSFNEIIKNLSQESIDNLADQGITVAPNSEHRVKATALLYLTTDTSYYYKNIIENLPCPNYDNTSELPTLLSDVVEDPNVTDNNIDRLYKDSIGSSNMQHFTMSVGSKIANLKDVGWNDTVSSVTLAPNSSMLLYYDANYAAGPPVFLNNGIHNTHMRLNLTAVYFNDVASSVKTMRP